MKLALVLCAALLALFAPTALAVPPTPVITGPPAIGNQTMVSFSWTAVDGVTYTCRLDAAEVAECTQPVTVTPGDHVYAVHAADAEGGVADAAYSFTVDTTPPAA